MTYLTTTTSRTQSRREELIRRLMDESGFFFDSTETQLRANCVRGHRPLPRRQSLPRHSPRWQKKDYKYLHINRYVHLCPKRNNSLLSLRLSINLLASSYTHFEKRLHQKFVNIFASFLQQKTPPRSLSGF